MISMISGGADPAGTLDWRLVQADGRQALAICGNVFVNVLRQAPTIDSIDELRRVSRQMQQSHGEQFGSLSVLEPWAVANVPDEVRKASEAYAHEFKPLASAIVIEGGGFRGAALRLIVAGMYLLKSSRYPHKICATPLEGATWLAPRLPAGSPRADNLVQVVAGARAALR
jgi:hypothetical protein